jgi:hypothetical protein
MREKSAATQADAALRRHRLRVRTVAVSFAAAVRSAHRDLEVGDVGRDALIETWRAWAISALDGYARDVASLLATTSLDKDEEEALEGELERGYRTVRDA